MCASVLFAHMRVKTMNKISTTRSQYDKDEKYQTQNRILKELIRELNQMSDRIDKMRKEVTTHLVHNYERP